MHKFLGVAAGALAGLCAAGVADAATIKVAPSDDIQAKIDGASPGDTLVFGKGTFNQTFVVTKSLNLKGAGKKTILDGSGLEGAILGIADGVNDVSITGLTFRFSSEEGILTQNSNRASGILVTKSLFLGNTQNDAIDLYSDDATLSKNLFRSNSLDFNVDGSNTLADRNSHRASGYGFYLYGNSTLDRSSFDRTYYAGYFYNGMPTVSRNTFSRVNAGPDLDGSTDGGLVQQNRVERTGDWAIYVQGTGHNVESNTLTRCYDGIYIGGTNSTVASNRIGGAGFGSGVYGEGSQGITVENNVITGAGWEGIYLSGGTSATIVGNTVTDANEVAIRTSEMSNCVVESNRISGALYAGMDVSDGNSQVIRNNLVGDVDGGFGIYVRSGSGGGNTIENNTIDACLGGLHYYFPIWYYAPGAPGVIRNNVVRDSGYLWSPAMNITGMGDGTVEDNDVLGSDGVGIRLDSMDNSTIGGNVVRDTQLDGIWLRSNSDIGNNVLENNQVINALAEGIQNDASNVGTGTVIRNNVVTGAGVQPFANDGNVNTGLSTGNTPQPADWGNIPSKQDSNSDD
jgi:parallel beta-helix repeat protein